jgi:hypothetical protein
MSVIRPPISKDQSVDSWANQVTEAINKGLFAPSVNPADGVALIAAGINNSATLFLYARTNTANAPTAVDELITYNYKTASFEGDGTYGSANWTASPPNIANGNYLWLCVVNISASVGKEIIQTGSWSTPQIFSVNGSSSFALEAFLRSSSVPSTPTGGSYSFATKVLTPPSGGWTQAFPSGSDPVYIVTAIASVVGTEGVDSDLTWSAPVKLVENGSTGASTNIIFQRSATQPTTPNPSSGIPFNWYDDASNATGTSLLWASSGFKSVDSLTFTWSTPFRIEGEAVAEVAVYRLNSNAGLTNGTYNFVTNTLTPPTGWSISAPSLANDGDIVYRASGVASGSAKETAATVTFGTAVIFSRQINGVNGIEVESGLVYYNQASTNNPGTPSATDYDFNNGAFTSLTSGWQTTPVTVNVTTTSALFWSSRFRITLTSTDGTPTITFDTPIPSVNFGVNIQSDNYVAETSGWQIQRDSGNAEFNNVFIRGGLILPSLVAAAITSKSITADQIDVDTLVIGSKNILTIDGSAIATRRHRTTIDDYTDGLNNVIVGTGSANGSIVTSGSATQNLRYRFSVAVDLSSSSGTNNLRTKRYYYPLFTANTGYSIEGDSIEVYLVDDITSAQTTSFYVGVDAVDFYSAGGNNNSRQVVLSIGTSMYLNKAEILRLIDPAVEFKNQQSIQLFEVKFIADGTNVPSFTAFALTAYAVNIEEFFSQSAPGLYTYTDTFEQITNVQLTGTTSTTAYVTNVTTSNLVTNGSGAIYGIIRGY